jgi:hypothetical protein
MLSPVRESASHCMIPLDPRGQRGTSIAGSPVGEGTIQRLILWVLEVGEGAIYSRLSCLRGHYPAHVPLDP